MTAQFRNIVTCLLGLGIGVCQTDKPPNVQLFEAATQCEGGVPTVYDVRRMSRTDLLVFHQTQKAAQENVASALSRRDVISPCDAAWALAPR